MARVKKDNSIDYLIKIMYNISGVYYVSIVIS